MTRVTLILLTWLFLLGRQASSEIKDPTNWILARQISGATTYFEGKVVLSDSSLEMNHEAEACLQRFCETDTPVSEQTVLRFRAVNTISGGQPGTSLCLNDLVKEEYYSMVLRPLDEGVCEVIESGAQGNLQGLLRAYPGARALITLSRVGVYGDQALVLSKWESQLGVRYKVDFYRYHSAKGGFWSEFFHSCEMRPE